MLFGDFLQVNCYFVDELKLFGLWMSEVCDQIKLVEGLIQGIVVIFEWLWQIYCIVWELLQKVLIDLVVVCVVFIDQSQLLNLFMENLNIGQLSLMYMYVWKVGIKMMYYLCLWLVMKIVKVMVSVGKVIVLVDQEQVSVVVFCLLENFEYCEVC